MSADTLFGCFSTATRVTYSIHSHISDITHLDYILEAAATGLVLQRYDNDAYGGGRRILLFLLGIMSSCHYRILRSKANIRAGWCWLPRATRTHPTIVV
jgi:hypothetical protein